MFSGNSSEAAEIVLSDEEIHYLQEYANVVSIQRLNYNDHGPVHMRKVALNALTMADLLNRAGIKLNLEKEARGTFDDSKIAVLLGALLHDVGMTVGRERHEHFGALFAIPVIDRVLSAIYGENLEKRVILRSMIVEGVVGHMTTQDVHSIEAGLILIGDGCDMEKGRARIPMMLKTESKVGDIHQYSASSIEKVRIEEGQRRPIRIVVEMKASVGFFQVEEVLYRKIDASAAKPHIELYAGVIGREMKCYL
jgi:hypothetical protein